MHSILIASVIEPGGYLQWIDPSMTARDFKAVQAQAVAPRKYLVKAIDTVNRWASLLGKTLDGCKRLPDIFRDSGLESIQHDLISTDNDPSTRRDFSVELTTAFEAIFKRMVAIEGSDLTVEEVVALSKGMLAEVEGGKAYLRMDVDIVIGRKPEALKL